MKKLTPMQRVAIEAANMLFALAAIIALGAFCFWLDHGF